MPSNDEILNAVFDGTNNALKTNTTVTADIEIGAVEIKNATDDTRATVGANGLHVDVRSIAAGTNNIGDVDVLTEPATAADGTGTLPAVVKIVGGTDGTNTQALSTDTNGRANVNVVDALPAGTNAIGKLAANSGVDIGDVDILSVTPGTAAANLGKAEDAIHATGDVGVMALGVRQAANAPLSGADGDYEPLQTDANGHLKVNVIDALPAGTNAIGKLAANSGVDIGDVDVLSIAAGDNNIGNVDIVTVPAPLSTTGSGTEATALRVTVATDSTGVLSVDDNAGSLTVDNAALSVVGGGVEATALRVTIASDSTGVLSIDDNAGSLTVDGTVTASNAAGDVAHDGVDSGNPVKVGAKGYAFDGTAPQAAVAEGDRVNLISDLQGIAYVQTAHPMFWSVSADYAAAQTNATVKAAPGVGLSLFLTDIFISNGATAGNVTLLDGSGGTVLFECYPGVNGGAVFNMKNPIKLTANTLLAITSTTVTTHSVTICGFIA